MGSAGEGSAEAKQYDGWEKFGWRIFWSVCLLGLFLGGRRPLTYADLHLMRFLGCTDKFVSKTDDLSQH